MKKNTLHLKNFSKEIRVSPFTGLDYWTGILDWTTGLSYFPVLDKFVCLFIERSLSFYNQ